MKKVYKKPKSKYIGFNGTCILTGSITSSDSGANVSLQSISDYNDVEFDSKGRSGFSDLDEMFNF